MAGAKKKLAHLIQKAVRMLKRLLKNFPLKVQEIIDTIKLDKSKVLLLAQDERRFGRITETRSGWCPPMESPSHKKQIIREYFYVFAAVCPKI